LIVVLISSIKVWERKKEIQKIFWSVYLKNSLERKKIKVCLELMSRNATHHFNSTLMQNVRMISGKGEGYYPSLAEFQQSSAFEKSASPTYLTLGRLKSDKAHPPLSPLASRRCAPQWILLFDLEEIDSFLYLLHRG